MQIILVSNRLATARTLNITPRLIVFAIACFIAVSIGLSVVFSWVGVRLELPYVSGMIANIQQDHQRKTDEYVRENVSLMAGKLGQMQAKLLSLDSLSERISTLSGIAVPKNEQSATVKNGRGGPLIELSTGLSMSELASEIDRLSTAVEQSTGSLTVLESQLMERRIQTTLLPTIMPIDAQRIGSSFGRRLDPIAGIGAMHEGIDFSADVGTPVLASAGGVVVTSEYHPQYGYMIDIDHGNDFSSRYAHLARLDVKQGQIVKRGQKIAASGNTGRSTGPHLHFEVRFKGVAQNPGRFLKQVGALPLVAGATEPLVFMPETTTIDLAPATDKNVSVISRIKRVLKIQK